ncbi:RDD family protein [Antrihabitans spumae]|uniref:RDD family protein n=1 Tax=Antrihabitans spumae TaxID=3373370 RepID=A0ABW7KPP3_9NOCA
MQYEPAPFLRRLGARVLDLLICLPLTFLVAIPVSIVIVFPAVLIAGDSHKDAVYGPAAALCYFIAYVGVEVFLLIRRDGQTLGKGLFGLRVVPAAEWARPGLPIRAAVIRMLIIFLPFVFLSVAGGNPDVAAFDVLAWVGILSVVASLILAAIPRSGLRRSLHDLAASSRVVRAPRRKIELKQDLSMMLPGRIDMTKRL